MIYRGEGERAEKTTIRKDVCVDDNQHDGNNNSNNNNADRGRYVEKMSWIVCVTFDIIFFSRKQKSRHHW